MRKKASIPLAISGVTALEITLAYKFMPPEVPLLYGNAQGQEQIVPTWLLFVAPLISVAVLIINNILSSKIKEDLYKQALYLTSILINVMFLITITKIIFLVILI